MKKLILAALCAIAMPALAVDATLTWGNPTQWDDGSPLTAEQIDSATIEWARCTDDLEFPAVAEGSASAPGPVETYKVTSLRGNVIWCFRVATVAEGQLGLWSNTASGIWVRKPKGPVLNGPQQNAGTLSVVIE